MRKRIVFLSLVGAIGWHPVANAFNPIDWFFKNQVEDAVKDAIKDSAIDLMKQEAEKKLQSNKGMQVEKGTAKKSNETPVASAAAHKALPLAGPYRFSVPQGESVDTLKKGERGGYLDWFNNEWVPVFDAKGKVIGWNEYLSSIGRKRLKYSIVKVGAEDAKFVLVDITGQKLTKG